MFAETAQRIKQDLLKEGMLKEKHEVLIRQLILKFGMTEDEKVQIQNVQEPRLLDSALDAVVTGENKQELLARLR